MIGIISVFFITDNEQVEQQDQPLASLEEVYEAIYQEQHDQGGYIPPAEHYDFVEETFGRVNALAYQGGYIYSEEDDDFLKGQAMLQYKNEEYNTEYAPILPIIRIDRWYRNDNSSPTKVLDAYANDWRKFYLDTEGFEQVGDYLIGYPIVTAYSDHNQYYERQLNFPSMTDQEQSVKLAEDERFLLTGTITFHILLDEDKEVEEAIEEFSHLNVQIDGVKADYFGKILEEHYPNLDRADLKALIDVDILEEAVYLPKDGVVTVKYEFLGGLPLLPDGEKAKAQTEEEREALYTNPDYYPTLMIEGTEFPLLNAVDMEGEIAFQR